MQLFEHKFINFLIPPTGINNKNQIEIVGNSTGLKLLSKALLGMSGTERSDGFHIHVDDLYSINNENKSFIVSKVDDKK